MDKERVEFLVYFDNSLTMNELRRKNTIALAFPRLSWYNHNELSRERIFY